MRFSTRIIKGGALLEDTRRLLEAWDSGKDGSYNLRRIEDSRALAKSSSRQGDILKALRRRYLAGGPHVVQALKLLAEDPRAFREACYYETCRAEDLLAAFAGGALFTWYWQDGRREVVVGDVTRWLRSEAGVGGWGEYTARRVAQGLLSTLRDFGILDGVKGGQRKRILPPHLSIRGFAYVALREKERTGSDRAVVSSYVWRWYLLDDATVRNLFLDADRQGILRYWEAGSVVRIDWLVRDLEEVARVVAA
jgi:hypothetical protein